MLGFCRFRGAVPDLGDIAIHQLSGLRDASDGVRVQGPCDNVLNPHEIRRGSKVEEQWDTDRTEICLEALKSVEPRASPAHYPLLIVAHRRYSCSAIGNR